ncbi:MAG: nitroreductase family protein [Bacilli bacterium]|nr:nitroreductase family protein [Bacilli bacterium]
MDFENVIKERYSVRKFLDKPVEEEKIEKIMEACRLAPTAKNKQPIKVFVIKSSEGLEKIDSISVCRYNAPLVFLVCYDLNNCWYNEDKTVNSGIEDASICTTHMMLEAYNIGLGSCWINLMDYSKCREVFNLDENIVPLCLLDVGYSDMPAGPLHSKSKEIDEIFSVM